MERIQIVQRWLAIALVAAVPTIVSAEDIPLRQQALKLNDITGKDAISGKIRELMKDKPAAKKLLGEAVEMAKAKDQPFNYNGAFILARLATVTKDYDTGLIFYRACADQAQKLRSSKKLIEAYDAVIALLLEQKKYDELVRTCKEFLDLKGGQEIDLIKPLVFEQMVLGMCKAGKADEALKLVEKFIDENKGSWYFVRLKAEVLAENGRYSDAAAAFDDALEKIKDSKTDDDKPDTGNQERFHNQCRVSMERLVVDFTKRSKYDDAVKLLDELVKIDVYFARLKGEVLRDSGKLDESAAALNSAIEQFEKSNKLNEKIKKALIERCRYVLSGVLTDLNQIDKAAGELQALLKDNPENATYNNDLGYIWADHDINLDESEKLIRKALEIEKAEREKAKDAGMLDPEDDRSNSAYLDSLGWVLYKKKQFADAKRYLLEASQSPEGQHVEILGHLGDVHLALGEKAEAIAVWKKALDTDNQSKRDTARKEAVRKKLEKEQGENP
jgi:tetratricopeptide (TPR) repeat protein